MKATMPAKLWFQQAHNFNKQLAKIKTSTQPSACFFVEFNVSCFIIKKAKSFDLAFIICYLIGFISKFRWCGRFRAG